MTRRTRSRVYSAVLLGFSLWTIFGTGIARAESDAPRLTASAIQRVLAAAVAKAEEIKVPMGITILDEGGNLVGFIKMDGAFVHTSHTSYSKAYTSVSVRKPSHETNIPASVTTEIASITQGKFTGLPGGMPLMINGRMVGAIGVGGGKGDQDIAVAKAGAEALSKP